MDLLLLRSKVSTKKLNDNVYKRNFSLDDIATRLHNEELEDGKSYWNNIQHQRQLFDHLTQKWNLSSLADWYTVSTQKVASAGGSSLLKIYGNSLPKGTYTYH